MVSGDEQILVEYRPGENITLFVRDLNVAFEQNLLFTKITSNVDCSGKNVIKHKFYVGSEISNDDRNNLITKNLDGLPLVAKNYCYTPDCKVNSGNKFYIPVDCVEDYDNFDEMFHQMEVKLFQQNRIRRNLKKKSDGLIHLEKDLDRRDLDNPDKIRRYFYGERIKNSLETLLVDKTKDGIMREFLENMEKLYEQQYFKFGIQY